MKYTSVLVSYTCTKLQLVATLFGLYAGYCVSLGEWTALGVALRGWSWVVKGSGWRKW